MPALLFVILAVEATDLIFALDSIPAVLAITRDPFIVYTSNIFAILGLRSLYFVLAGLLDKLRLLHYGLAVILAFVALKMLLVRWIEVPVTVSLAVILATLVVFAIASKLVPEKKHN
jgi:tellurite resistance protein TerC